MIESTPDPKADNRDMHTKMLDATAVYDEMVESINHSEDRRISQSDERLAEFIERMATRARNAIRVVFVEEITRIGSS